MSDTSTKRQPQGRSPSYPSVPLAVALEKAKAQYDAEGKYLVPLSSAFKAWGYSPKSSGGRDVRASLRYFGLISVEGDGDMAKVKLTEDALRVLTDKREDQTEKNEIIRRLALNPTAHKKLWAKYPEGIKSDATAAHYLVWEEGFNESAAEALVTEFKETATFARLYEPDSMKVISGDLADETPPSQIAVGDLVQVEIGGVLQLAKPARVRAIQDHQGQTWAFIEGSETGVPMEQLVLETKGAGVAPPLTPPLLPEPKGDLRTAGGEREWLRGPLSKETSYRLIVAGDLGPKEIGKLIKLLKAQQAVLSDEDDDEGGAE